jgi:protein-S-isoprenylcysteine O-methyltransferase Ste14
MVDFDPIFRTATIILLIVWRVYWHVSELKTEREKPIQKKSLPFIRQLSMAVVYAAFGVVGVQLLGISLFALPQKIVVLQLLGFLLVLTGFVVSIKGRQDLGTNWARCYDYQVKHKQTLVTYGIYRFIRHPLYSGIALLLIGAELLMQSYLVIPYLFLFLGANQQAKWEEQLLIKHFGDQYRDYMKRTKRLLPFIW